MWSLCCNFYKKSEEYVVGYVPMLNVYEVDDNKISSFSVDSLNVEIIGGLNSYDLIKSIKNLYDYGIYSEDIEYIFVIASYAYGNGYFNPQTNRLLYNPQRISESIDKLLQVISIGKKNREYYGDIVLNIERYNEEKQLLKLKDNLSIAIKDKLLVEFIIS